MKKIVAVALAATFISTAAMAQGYHRDHRGGGGGGGWVAPLVGGLILGGVVGSVMSQPRYAPPMPVYVEPVCYDRIVAYDAWRRPIISRVCE
ncbi:hypothetical protein UFOVP29_330 [uncultured Caudovirales phage]|uniref:Uncharacterized protein n=1 Tax=uncultured Caudovirales phage TaxID=2100421 RepID=A0A6J5KN03_9CAUD|nr:hypothetical protein UFOVP29_330 [uncultured Caudovirales phage]